METTRLKITDLIAKLNEVLDDEEDIYFERNKLLGE
jgi:hypothetical protein